MNIITKVKILTFMKNLVLNVSFFSFLFLFTINILCAQECRVYSNLENRETYKEITLIDSSLYNYYNSKDICITYYYHNRSYNTCIFIYNDGASFAMDQYTKDSLLHYSGVYLSDILKYYKESRAFNSANYYLYSNYSSAHFFDYLSIKYYENVFFTIPIGCSIKSNTICFKEIDEKFYFLLTVILEPSHLLYDSLYKREHTIEPFRRQ